MNKKLKKEIKQIIEDQKLNCTIKEFEDKVDWVHISVYQKLSEEFIEKYQDKFDWKCISMFQKLSKALEDFIEK
jgi:hypothetical protein